jgi:TrmH family RNA methyltransferase
MGSLFRVKVRIEPDLPDFVLQNVHTSIAAAVTSDADFQINSSMTQYLIIGNEGRGIRNEILTIPGLRKIQIRGFGKAESLNASVAAGILAYQIRNS